jgi:hypothetical protein
MGLAAGSSLTIPGAGTDAIFFSQKDFSTWDARINRVGT